MKVHLLHREGDGDPTSALAHVSAGLTQDLGLEAIFEAMAQGDQFLLDIARRTVLASLTDPEAISYRQHILEDALAHPAVVREMYAIAVETIERERKIWGWTLNRYPETVLHRSLEALAIFVEASRGLRRIAEAHAGRFHSEGFTRLFSMLRKELSEEYLKEVEGHIRRLGRRDAILLTARLGEGNRAADYRLCAPPVEARSLLERLQSWVGQIAGSAEPASYVYEIAERDEGGMQALSDIRAHGLAAVASSVGHSADHILGFFRTLRAELGFFVAALNLHDRVTEKGEPLSIPEAVGAPRGTPAHGSLEARADAHEAVLSARGLYDMALALRLDGRAVGNDLSADGKQLIVITGANRGGKTTFHRSLGQAQLLMQCGLFVGAQSYRASIASGLFTHYKREEDREMKLGKLEEELRRMSAIIDDIRSGGLLLCNESFASTNEREGSEIARQIVRALIEAGVRVIYVTHLYDLARGWHCAHLPGALFLRAERLSDGRRTFRIVEGEPLPTSHGQDLYRQVFGPAPEPKETTARA